MEKNGRWEEKNILQCFSALLQKLIPRETLCLLAKPLVSDCKFFFFFSPSPCHFKGSVDSHLKRALYLHAFISKVSIS